MENSFNHYIYDDKLTLADKGLLTILLKLPNGFKKTQENIRKIVNNGLGTIRKSLENLQAEGYLEIIKEHNGKFNTIYNPREVSNLPNKATEILQEKDAWGDLVPKEIFKGLNGDCAQR